MQDMTAGMTALNDLLGKIVWGPAMIALMLGTGVYMTFRTGGIQFFRPGYVIKITVGSLFRRAETKIGGKNVTPFQAMTTALAGTVGVGNVAGVAGAIVAGGPGAVFWMWVSAFFGMAIKFSEIALSIRFRKTDEAGRYLGGPMYYIERGLKKKRLAALFALLGGIASFGIGNMTQASEISAAVTALLGIPPGSSAAARTAAFVGGALAMVSALVIFGGIRRIGRVTEIMVPCMALFYVFGGVLLLALHAGEVSDAFQLIFREAFSLRAAGGGILGSTMARAVRHGVARGLFSNEAGLGSAPIAHAASEEKDPVRQGLWGIFEVFAATILLCTITALVILVSGQAGVAADLSGAPLTGGALTATAFESLAGVAGGIFVRTAVLLFALSTIFGWSYYGCCCFGYIFGEKRSVVWLYQGLFVFFTAVGAMGDLQLIWGLSDTMNGMMAIPNLIGIIGLSGEVERMTRTHFVDNKNKKTRHKI